MVEAMIGLAVAVGFGIWLRYHPAQLAAWVGAVGTIFLLSIFGSLLGDWRFGNALLVGLGGLVLGALLPDIPARGRVAGAVIAAVPIFWTLNPQFFEGLFVQLLTLAIIVFAFGVMVRPFRRPRSNRR